MSGVIYSTEVKPLPAEWTTVLDEQGRTKLHIEAGAGRPVPDVMDDWAHPAWQIPDRDGKTVRQYFKTYCWSLTVDGAAINAEGKTLADIDSLI
jgi:hypothetical protein